MSATKYKPGDRVRVKDIHLSESLGGYNVTAGMEELANKIVTIETKGKVTYKVKEYEHARWTDEMFEPLKSTFAVGDKVRIKKRIGSSSDYPYGFMDEMTPLAGNVYEIKEVYKSIVDYSGRKYYGDNYIYILKGPCVHGYKWSDTMLELADEKKDEDEKLPSPLYKVGDKVRIKKRIGSAGDYPNSFTDSMTERAGEVFTIENISASPYLSHKSRKYPGDCYDYYLKDIGYTWASSMFEPVDKPTDEPIVDLFDDESTDLRGKKMNFKVGKQVLKYEFAHNHLKNVTTSSSPNDEIFNLLNIKDKVAFCTQAYGYSAGNGIFPVCTIEDWSALTRVADALLRECLKHDRTIWEGSLETPDLAFIPDKVFKELGDAAPPSVKPANDKQIKIETEVKLTINKHKTFKF